MDNAEFGKYLKELRQKRNLNIRQVEAYAGVSNSYLSQVENGKTGIPSPKILKKLSTIYKVELDDIMLKAGWTNKVSSIIEETDKSTEASEYYAIVKKAIDKGISKEKLEKLIELL